MAGGGSRRSGRPGFALVELAVVVLIVSILAGIALPVYHRALLKARATSVLSELQAVRVAAFNYNADTGEWPADTQPGRIPRELADYLPTGFRFEREEYQLDWENWVLPDGTPKHPGTGVLLGVSLTTEDPALGHAVTELLGPNTAHYTLGNNYTFVIAAK